MMRNGTSTSFGQLQQIDAGLLNVSYAEAGKSDGPAVMLLHGWPYDIHSFVDVAPRLSAQGYRVIVPSLRDYGSTRFLSSDTLRNGQPSVVALDTIALLDALKIERAILAGFDWGARSANIIAALYPERCKGHVSVSGYLIGGQAADQVPLPPPNAAWPTTTSTGTTLRSSSGSSPRPSGTRDEAFDNPDHVSIVIHNYRWRLGLAEGEPRYDELEQRLAQAPTITVPTITLEDDANGAPHPEASTYASKFTGRSTHRLITGGIGHNLPQEAPLDFAQAIVDVDGF
jgi:pimeloyl-ACP methyl ester carboxylesterase